MRYSLMLMLLFSGCLQQTVIEENFVCSDGWVVDSPGDCVGHERVCPDCICPDCECPSCGISGNSEDDVRLDYQLSTDPCVALGCPEGTKFVASRNSDKYHSCGCEWAAKISEKNLLCYDSAPADRVPCRVCV
ncbi:MAG: hypothetical protein GF416_08635 [Candidatus Altiarchaeales archaeon]|nr:hypothetical protein [Candidatus Altiarchaeales archaeon]MBD3417182.1 hypothetical protein [Candidatus Altiarchaeales archaeon]